MPGTGISGYVRTEDGSPVGGAVIDAIPQESSEQMLRTTTDSDGYYEFDEYALHTGIYEYHVVCRTDVEGERAKESYPYIRVRGKYDKEYISQDWSLFTPEPPHDYEIESGSLSSSIESTSYSDQDALVHNQNGARGSDQDRYWYTSSSYDATGKSTMLYSTEFTADYRYDQFKIMIEDETVFEADSDVVGSHDWTDRTHDISEYDGYVELKIGHSVSGGNNRSPTSRITNVKFE